MQKQRLKAMLEQLGFKNVMKLTRGKSIREFLLRCYERAPSDVPSFRGLYALVSAQGTFYLGQSKNVLRRLGQHRETKTLLTFEWVAFMPLETLDLAMNERALIALATRLGFPLSNKQQTVQAGAGADAIALEALVAPVEQSRFIEGDAHANWIALWRAAHPAEREAWLKFLTLPHADKLLILARAAVAELIIKPRVTLEHAWQAELPGGSRRDTRPVLALYAGNEQILRFFWRPSESHPLRGPSAYYARLRLNTRFLLAPMKRAERFLATLSRNYPAYQFSFVSNEGLSPAEFIERRVNEAMALEKEVVREWQNDAPTGFTAPSAENALPKRRACPAQRSALPESNVPTLVELETAIHAGAAIAAEPRRVQGLAKSVTLDSYVELICPAEALPEVLAAEFLSKAARLEAMALMAQRPALLTRHNRLLAAYLLA